jgi:hypothetical protein
MTSPTPSPTKTRGTTLALLHALPAILLISLLLWTFAGTSAVIFALAIDLDIIGIVLSAALFVAPAVWANWHVIRLAVASERVADE